MVTDIGRSHVTEYRHLLLQIYETHREQVQHEDTLINHRASWLVTSQSFLLGTYVFLVNSPVVHLVDGAQIQPYSDKINFNAGNLTFAVKELRWCFSVAGLVASLFVGISVWAALFALRDVVSSYRNKLKTLDETMIDVPADLKRGAKALLPSMISRKLYARAGCASCIVLPNLFVSVWLIVLVANIGWWQLLVLAILVLVVLAVAEVFLFAKVAPYRLAGNAHVQ